MRCGSLPLSLVVVAVTIAACEVVLPVADAFSVSRTVPSSRSNRNRNVNVNVNVNRVTRSYQPPNQHNRGRRSSCGSSSTTSTSTALSATGPFHLFVSQIGATVRTSPVLKNCIMCMWLSAIGDVLAQRFEQLERSKMYGETTKGNALDPGRVLRLATFGFVVSGPLYSTWYPFLDRLSNAWSLANYGVWTPPIVKMVLEMIFIEPLFLISFFGFMHFVGTRNNTIQSFARKIRTEFVPTYKASLTVWPPFMLLSFRFVPLSSLPALVNVANTMWDGYLSYRHSITATNHEHHPSYDSSDDSSSLTIMNATPTTMISTSSSTTTTTLVGYPMDTPSLETCPACS